MTSSSNSPMNTIRAMQPHDLYRILSKLIFQLGGLNHHSTHIWIKWKSTRVPSSSFRRLCQFPVSVSYRWQFSVSRKHDAKYSAQDVLSPMIQYPPWRSEFLENIILLKIRLWKNEMRHFVFLSVCVGSDGLRKRITGEKNTVQIRLFVCYIWVQRTLEVTCVHIAKPQEISRG